MRANIYYKMVASLAVEALDVKRCLFDAGFQEAHNRVAEAEAELHKALNEVMKQLAGDTKQ
jgi:hypothetical protein